ncbi:hydantoinase/oxoprolinase family protein [Salinicoccus cyprini]|uniref:Hydantoinase/oxoprolinase family protein n=1 Tax=Salinicoccus cyprini TaxID=2493691 RepID=A0A558AT41_9STAP|nr:hydantoinase/oxoprolinase family protein [Salinicoccus cyprini]TVT27420.1 hydantoinase/oxoprolinase family protein [Salinicoccus cyprini]
MKVTTDIGGTFTDLLYLDDNGDFIFDKAHTTPPNFEDGVMNVMAQSGLDYGSIEMFIHGSTVVINTLTERKGAKVGLITTKGTRDVLEIARGNRPDLYNFKYKKPEPFVERYLRWEVEERMNYKGEVLQTLNEQDVIDAIEHFRDEGVEAIAVCLLHAYKNPEHEIEITKLINEKWPELPVTASHEMIKEWREYERTNTTVLNAYVKPVMESYIDSLDGRLNSKTSNNNRYIMQSNGGITSFSDSKKYPLNLVESGPVAGVYGAAILGEIIGESNIISFDIGGTTAKCSLISEGNVKVSTDYYIEKNDKYAGYPIKVPVVDIVEIGNGGGSIAWIDELGSLKVGPQSAGSVPGPVSYGQGGEKATTTDANLYIGRLSDKNFDSDVDFSHVREAIDRQVAGPFGTSTEDGALGIIDIANSNMLNALKLISVRKGYNPQDFTMIAFGGGGPMHAAELARDLKIKKVVIPHAASVFSAWGMLMSDARKDNIQTYLKKFSALDFEDINKQWTDMENASLEDFSKNNLDRFPIEFERSVDLRYEGQEHTVKMPIENDEWDGTFIEEAKLKFHEMHEFTYSFKLEHTEVEIVNMHLTTIGKIEKPDLKELETNGLRIEETIKETRNVYYKEHGWVETKIYDRNLLREGHSIEGPAVIEEKTSSTLVLENQQADIDVYGNIILTVEVKSYD